MGKTKQKQKFSRKNRKGNSDEGYDIWEPFYWEK